jgi:hypothetical protein
MRNMHYTAIEYFPERRNTVRKRLKKRKRFPCHNVVIYDTLARGLYGYRKERMSYGRP